MKSDIIPSLEIDPFDEAILMSPFAMHDRIREAGPVVYIPKYRTYATARYDTVREVLGNAARFPSKSGGSLADIRDPATWREPSVIVDSDPPFHTNIRKVVQKIIALPVIRGWEALFTADAAKLADEVVATGRIDAVTAIAEPFIIKVLPDALGLGVARDHLVLVGAHAFNSMGPPNAIFQRSKARIDAVAEWFQSAQDRGTMIPGGFGEKIFEAEDAGDLEPGSAFKLVASFLRGGMDTTIAGIGHMLMYVSQRPDLWTDMRKDRGLIRRVLDESLRLQSPSQTFFRIASERTEIGGVPIEPDVKIQLFLGAANRDPRKWERADEFDIQRPGSGGHLAFGFGAHMCVGQMIARMEVESIFNALLDRVAAVEPDGEPAYRLSNALRTLDTLPIRLVAA